MSRPVPPKARFSSFPVQKKTGTPVPSVNQWLPTFPSDSHHAAYKRGFFPTLSLEQSQNKTRLRRANRSHPVRRGAAAPTLEKNTEGTQDASILLVPIYLYSVILSWLAMGRCLWAGPAGPAHHFFRRWASARPSPSKRSSDGPRPGPARPIFRRWAAARPGPSNI